MASACDVPADRIEDALRALVRMDPDGARAALGQAETAFACASVAPADLARYWLVEGALASFARERDEATEAFRAASRADPTIWIVDLGPDLLRAKEAAASAPVEDGRIELKDTDPGYGVRLDGRAASLPADVPAGLHLVQLADGEDVRFGLVAFVLAGRTSAIEPGLPPLGRPVVPTPAPPLASVPVPERPRARTEVRAHLGVGGSLAFGEALVRRTAGGDVETEPATKVLVPLEVGGSVERSGGFARGTVTVAPLLGGRLLFLGADGIRGTPLAVAPGLAAGATWRPVYAGLAFGLTLPSRVTPAALVGLEVPGAPVRVELRAGANLLPERRPEPCATLLAAFVPGAG